MPKYLGTAEFLILLVPIFCFGFGTYLGRGGGFTPVPAAERARQREPLELAFWLGWSLVMLANAIWYMMAIKRGFSLAMIKENLGSDDKSVGVEYLKTEIFETIPGVTTATQFGMTCAVMAVYLFAQEKRPRYLFALGCIILTTLGRSFFRAERLALIETVIPAIVTAVWVFYRSGRVISRRTDLLIRYSPILFLIVGITIFGFFEYFRSWKYYRNEQTNFTSFVLDRFTGYYATSYGNAALVINEKPNVRFEVPLPYFTLHFFWNFPLTQSLCNYEQITGMDVYPAWMNHIGKYGNMEYNTHSGLTYPLLDFGIPLGCAAWIMIGYGVGLVYRWFQAGSLVGILLYPLFWVCLLDFPRTCLLFSGRYFPSYLLVLGFVILRSWQGHLLSQDSAGSSLRPNEANPIPHLENFPSR